MNQFIYLDNHYLIITSVIFLFGGFVKGVIGVGLPTITLALLSLFFDIKESISVILIPIILTNFYQMIDGKDLKLIYKDTRFFALSSFVFIVPGFFLLFFLKSKIILSVLAVLLILNSSLNIFKFSIKFNNYQSTSLQSLLGSLNGFISGLTGIYTMPFVFFLQSLNYTKDKAIQLMGYLFFIYSTSQFLLFLYKDMINMNKFFISLFACAPIFIGVVLGRSFRKKISENFFKLLFNYMLLLMGLLLIFKN